MYDGDGVEVGQAIGHISEDAGLVRERDVGVCLHALIKVHVHVLHDETDVCLVATIMDSHELDPRWDDGDRSVAHTPRENDQSQFSSLPSTHLFLSPSPHQNIVEALGNTGAVHVAVPRTLHHSNRGPSPSFHPVPSTAVDVTENCFNVDAAILFCTLVGLPDPPLMHNENYGYLPFNNY